MLLLVCDACAAATAASSADSSAESQLQPGIEEAEGAGIDLQQPQQQQYEQNGQLQDGQGLACELCQRRKQQGTTTSAGGRRLRILCLHGFRQSAKNFEVR
jgi:hypothetical protein